MPSLAPPRGDRASGRRWSQEEGHRSIVHELDLHHRSEHPGLHLESAGLQRSRIGEVQLVRLRGLLGPVERRAQAPARRPREGELRHDEDGTAGPVSVTREPGGWRLSDLSTAFLRSELSSAFSDGSTLARSLRECMIRAIAALDDHSLRTMAFGAMSGTSGGGQAQNPASQAGIAQTFGQAFGAPQGMGVGSGQSPPNVQPVQFANLQGAGAPGEQGNIGLLMDVYMELTVELGRTRKLIREILGIGEGTIIELDKLAGEPVDILVNHKLIAKGEVVVIDENFGVRVTEIVSPMQRMSDLT